MHAVCGANSDGESWPSERSGGESSPYHAHSLRIVAGEGARPGMFPYAATFTHDPTNEASREANCGATLISRQHLLTVAHCLPNPDQKPAYVLLGGVCIQKNEADGCADLGAEMLRAVEIDFILTHYYDYSLRDNREWKQG